MSPIGTTHEQIEMPPRVNNVWTVRNELWKLGVFEREPRDGSHLPRWKRRV